MAAASKSLSWTACVIAVVALFVLAAFVTTDRQRKLPMLKDMDIEFPASTKLMLLIPSWAIYAVAVGGAALVLIVQWAAKSKSGATVFHMAIIVFAFFLYVLYRETLLEPVVKIFQTVTDNRYGG